MLPKECLIRLEKLIFLFTDKANTYDPDVKRIPVITNK